MSIFLIILRLYVKSLKYEAVNIPRTLKSFLTNLTLKLSSFKVLSVIKFPLEAALIMLELIGTGLSMLLVGLRVV